MADVGDLGNTGLDVRESVQSLVAALSLNPYAPHPVLFADPDDRFRGAGGEK
jgi:hypothetical protein